MADIDSFITGRSCSQGLRKIISSHCFGIGGGARAGAGGPDTSSASALSTIVWRRGIDGRFDLGDAGADGGIGKSNTCEVEMSMSAGINGTGGRSVVVGRRGSGPVSLLGRLLYLPCRGRQQCSVPSWPRDIVDAIVDTQRRRY